MRCKLIYTDPVTCTETLQNVRYSDEIAEDRGMSDDELRKFEFTMNRDGRYWLSMDLCAYRA